ncbi:MAG: type II toxin-antitoxin system Phd/YefM family antitoxin [Clostridiales Family XIII bacterium]|jgi:prevent-host-death family protein|nr:type II toxin-antitoxin system Phd/YefM family antitoxin [Clostridiales Family XIII bacterium]
MPIIKPSAELRNNYGEISEFCHKHKEPVFITKNGTGDLAVMSIEAYEEMAGRFELHALLEAGLEDMREGRGIPSEEVFAGLRGKLKRRHEEV